MKKNSMTKKLFPYLVLGAVLIAVDQLTKWFALSKLSSGAYSVTPWLTFRLVFNRGISWGIFNSDKMVPFVLIGIANIIIVTVLMMSLSYFGLLNRKPIPGQVFALTFVIAGAIANIIDRFVHHAVIDFIQLSYKGWSWPVFNIADCCIVFALLFMIVQQYRSK